MVFKICVSTFDFTSVVTSSTLLTVSLTSINIVRVKDGLFSVMLGSTTSVTGVNFNQSLYLSVESGGTGSSPV